MADLRIGQSAMIVRLGDEELSLKLLEMGCLPGETVVLQYIAPLGDPVCVRVSGYNLSLRKSEAAAIWIQVAADETMTTKDISILSKPVTVA